MKEIVLIRTTGPAFEGRPSYSPRDQQDVSYYQPGMGETAFDVTPSQQDILRQQIAAGCTLN